MFYNKDLMQQNYSVLSSSFSMQHKGPVLFLLHDALVCETKFPSLARLTRKNPTGQAELRTFILKMLAWVGFKKTKTKPTNVCVTDITVSDYSALPIVLIWADFGIQPALR